MSYTGLLFSLVIFSPHLWGQENFIASGFCLRSFSELLRLSSGKMQKTSRTKKCVSGKRPAKRRADILFAS